MLKIPVLTIKKKDTGKKRAPLVTKPFHLFMAESKGIAKGVLTQKLGPWKRLVAYLLKKIDTVAAGWPACLWIMAAVTVLLKDSDKLIMDRI